MKRGLFVVFVVLLSTVYSQENKSSLSLDEIMKGNTFIGEQPSEVFWNEESTAIYFQWNPERNLVSSMYKYDLTKKEIEKVSIEEERMISNARDFDYSEDFSKKVFIKNGDIYLYELPLKRTKLLMGTFNERESNVVFNQNASQIRFQKGGNLYTFDLSSGATQQITNFVSGKDKSKKESTAQETWLKQQQLDLFEVLRDRKERKHISDEHKDRLAVKQPKTIYLGSKNLSYLTMTGNGDYISYRLSKYPTNKRTMVPHFVSESGHTKEQLAYAKVGGEQASHELWILDVERDTTLKVDYSSLTGVFKKPLYLAEYEGNEMDDYEKPKAVNFFKPKVGPDGKSTVVEVRSMDNKDRWFAKIDFEKGVLIQLNHQHDEAWIAGPGIPWQQSGGDWGWLDRENIWYHSEKSGYSHLYELNIKNSKEKALTSGSWEVHKANMSKDGKSMYLSTNEVHPGERHFYKLHLKNLKLEKLTKLTGNHEVTIAPNEKQFAIRHSFSNKPWELYMLANEKNAEEIQLTNSTTTAFNSYKWRVPENITFKASDGQEVYARMYAPESGTEGKPMVVFVHGAGYLQNAHKWWSGYYREFMFHNYLVDNGYVVLDIDYRASKGYGRDFRTGIYRHMGGKDLSDQVDGVKHMVEEYGIDKEHVGIYGGSYGGFITLMGMFINPDVFKSGAGIRSVTDWAHYHHSYTANILNTPVLDPKSYELSSPINFVKGLQGNLLILHGMIDDNVHFQDVVRLNQRLIELRKDNWQMALYPVERHGFIESSSWADEYKRIYRLFEETLKK